MERRMRGEGERSGEVLSSRRGDRGRSLIVVGGRGILIFIFTCAPAVIGIMNTENRGG